MLDVLHGHLCELTADVFLMRWRALEARRRDAGAPMTMSVDVA